MLIIQFSDASNPTFVTNAIKGALQTDPKSTRCGLSARSGCRLRGGREADRPQVANGSLGLSLGSLEALKNGDLLFIADLQPYLDGYYALLAAYQYVSMRCFRSARFRPGPLMITKDNVDEVLKINKDIPGVRGAS